MKNTSSNAPRSNDRHGRCVCGLLVALHYTDTNRKLECSKAQQLHTRAALKPRSLLQQFFQLVPKETK